jgi:hypothetical protein
MSQFDGVTMKDVVVVTQVTGLPGPTSSQTTFNRPHDITDGSKRCGRAELPGQSNVFAAACKGRNVRSKSSSWRF